MQLWEVGIPWRCCFWTAEHGRSQKRAQCGMSQNGEVIASWNVITCLGVEMLQILLMPYHRQTLFKSTKFSVETIMLSSLTCHVISASQFYV